MTATAWSYGQIRQPKCRAISTRCCYNIHPDSAAAFETCDTYESRGRIAIDAFSEARPQYFRDLGGIRVVRQIDHETDDAPKIQFGGFQSEPEVFNGSKGLILRAGFVQLSVGAPGILCRECEFTGPYALRKKHPFGKEIL